MVEIRGSVGKVDAEAGPSSSSRGVQGHVGAVQHRGLGPSGQVQIASAGPGENLQDAVVIYVHGIGNKPRPSVLKNLWDMALFGNDLGDGSRMAYWVNRKRFPIPLSRPDEPEDHAASVETASLNAPTPISDENLAKSIESVARTSEERTALAAISQRMASQETVDTSQFHGQIPGSVRAAVAPLPSLARQWLTRWITKQFLDDVHDYFFDERERRRIEEIFCARLNVGRRPVVVVAHSLGTVIAYNVLQDRTLLQRFGISEPDVRLLVTLGSPLGVQEVQDQLRKRWGNALPIPPNVRRWVNFADRLDPVAIDAHLENDFAPRGRIEDTCEWGFNPDSPKYPHSATGYLGAPAVKEIVRQTLGPQFGQAVRSFRVARDLAALAEDADPGERQPVLIQLDESQPGNLDDYRSGILAELRDMLGPDFVRRGEVDAMKRFIAAQLTRSEIEKLSAKFHELKIDRIWRNLSKAALLLESVQTVQAQPARLGYGSTGRDIGWAVLDTGVDAEHPHFSKHANIAHRWDCTGLGDVTAQGGDRHGHGTHVAAIIAGCSAEPLLAEGDRTVQLFGVAPETKIHSYKVLRDDGGGSDSYIIKALDHIAAANEKAGKPVIHGVNLSLGGDFDPSVFGCGHSPVCQELRRLWRQGVLVCIAAGNEGLAMLQSARGVIQTNRDLSIADPANLDEAIAVGATHKSAPHTYGVSYFSSRGPTADGRLKPDLVAPGERILSAKLGARQGKRVSDLYVEMSGTSMAAPHVSGILAAFLSVRQEFIGYPERVKEILLGACTDLRRDPYIQGRGMPNLVNMLLRT